MSVVDKRALGRDARHCGFYAQNVLAHSSHIGPQRRHPIFGFAREKDDGGRNAYREQCECDPDHVFSFPAIISASSFV